jgi:hypothetical protein
MRTFFRLWLAVVGLLCAAPAVAQFKDSEPGAVKLGDVRVQRWRAGMLVEAVGGPCQGIVGYVPFPAEWPEQDVKIVDEDVSPGVKISYDVYEGVKLMVVRIAFLPAGEKAKATVTVEVRRRTILPPENTEGYTLPDAKQLGRKLQPYLAPSPKIESRDPKIRALAKEIGADEKDAWKKVEAIYEWVRAKVKYKNGELKGALAALKDGTGDCEDSSSLFIAICRAAGIPARTVWVPGHCYPEFYLIDKDGKGRWFPCQAAGTPAFGGIPETRPVLQKGDNFRPPWDRRKSQRYMSEYLSGTPAPNGGQPQVRFLREQLGQ